MTTSVINNSVFRGFFEKQKLTGPNFIDWYRQLRIVLSVDDKLNYLEHPIPAAPVPAHAGQQVPPEALAAHAAWVKGQKEIDGLMLMTMELDIQRNLENLGVYDMLQGLKTLFSQQAEQELLQTVREFHACKQEEKQSVSSYVLKMKSYIDNLERLGKTVNELHAMLKLHEHTLPKKDAPALHAIRAGKGLMGSRKLKPGALSLYMGNGQRATVEAIGSYHLCFPSGLIVILHNCHYAPSITRGFISFSYLYDDGFINRFDDDDNTISVSMKNVVYFSAVPRDGIYEINLSNSNINDSSMYAVSNKRVKLNLDSALVWHYRLGHVSKKHIENLQHDGLFNSTDINSFEKCVSCMSGKMARKPYSHQVERAKDLLGLIHTDHKHEVLETFKVFQKEVENQLGKTIKSLCSDRGGEYMSQEFLDHLKEHGIIAHRTPPYTPQHNCMSEWRNRTLLDMDTQRKQWVILSTTHLRTKYFLLGMLNSLSLITQELSRSLEDHEIIQEEDTYPSENTSLHHDEGDQENDEPQSDIIPIQSKWLFKKKTNMDGAIHTYKSCLVGKGFTQTYRVGYEETFSPIADIRAIRILIAIDAFYNYEIWQIDFKTAFLNGHLSEEVYMVQPEGFVHPKYPNRVCKLKRSIYELKQASRQWNKRFDDEIKKFGFTQNHDEPCVYMKASKSNVTFLILYVDDILIMGNHIPMLQDVKSYLGKCFGMKDLGEAAYIFGIKILRDKSRTLIGLCQSAYIEKILKRFYMKNSKRESIPMQEKIKLSKSQGASTPVEVKRMQNVPYASAIGSIIYVVRCTRLDIAFAQNITSRFQQNLGDIKRELRVSCYTDAGYLTDAVDLTKFISGLGIVPIIEEPIKMYCDNTRAINIANESGITKGARHYRAKVYYLCEVIEFGDVKIEKVHADDNLVDPFTKALPFPKHSEHTKNIGMFPAGSLM
ncbi:retrotransposon protein, putative, ty1-copia subclass [Tanacetum coccineum]